MKIVGEGGAAAVSRGISDQVQPRVASSGPDCGVWVWLGGGLKARAAHSFIQAEQ